MRLAARMSRIGESGTVKVARRAAELRAQGMEIMDLGAGEPDFPSPPVAVEAACRALSEGFTKYTENNGIPELREALADSYRRRFQAPWSAAEALITVGAKAALFELALALLDEGDEVVLPAPCWVSFPEQIRLAGAKAVLAPTSAEDGFRIHAGPILEAVTHRTRVILINSPCNPTGGILPADDLREIVEGAAARGIVVISDETYERFVYDGAAHASAASLAASHPDTVVLVGSFSKTYAMTGWRVGFALGPGEVIRAAAAIQSHATSNPTSFAMKGALEALRSAEEEVQIMLAEYQARRDFLIPRLNELPGVSCQPPAGTFYAFPRVMDAYRDGCQGSGAFAEFLLEEARVAVVPGAAFGADDHVRISFAASREVLSRALEQMAAALSE